jgi:hypothetical protein
MNFSLFFIQQINIQIMQKYYIHWPIFKEKKLFKTIQSIISKNFAI